MHDEIDLEMAFAETFLKDMFILIERKTIFAAHFGKKLNLYIS